MRLASTTALAACIALGLAAAPGAWGQEHPDDAKHEAPASRQAQRAPPAKAPEAATRTRQVDTTHQVDVTHRSVDVTHQRVAQAGGGRWRSGDRFTADRVVFTNWGRYHLQAPGPGYEWVRDGDELLLINLNTGLVANIFLIPVP